MLDFSNGQIIAICCLVAYIIIYVLRFIFSQKEDDSDEGGLLSELYDFFFAPREYPWVPGWGRKKWLDKKKKEGSLSWEETGEVEQK